MKPIISNITVTGNNKVATCSATLTLMDDTETTELFSAAMLTKKRVDAPSGWYDQAKAALLDQAKAAIARYNDTMGRVVAETGMADVELIKVDIKTYIEEGL